LWLPFIWQFFGKQQLAENRFFAAVSLLDCDEIIKQKVQNFTIFLFCLKSLN